MVENPIIERINRIEHYTMRGNHPFAALLVIADVDTVEIIQLTAGRHFPIDVHQPMKAVGRVHSILRDISIPKLSASDDIQN